MKHKNDRDERERGGRESCSPKGGSCKDANVKGTAVTQGWKLIVVVPDPTISHISSSLMCDCALAVGNLYICTVLVCAFVCVYSM